LQLHKEIAYHNQDEPIDNDRQFKQLKKNVRTRKEKQSKTSARHDYIASEYHFSHQIGKVLIAQTPN